jgi:hypothetical protein
MNTRSKAIKRIMGFLKNIFHIPELRNRNNGPENFLLHDLHLLIHVGEHRGLDEVTLIAVTFPAQAILAPSSLPDLM